MYSGCCRLSLHTDSLVFVATVMGVALMVHMECPWGIWKGASSVCEIWPVEMGPSEVFYNDAQLSCSKQVKPTFPPQGWVAQIWGELVVQENGAHNNSLICNNLLLQLPTVSGTSQSSAFPRADLYHWFLIKSFEFDSPRFPLEQAYRHEPFSRNAEKVLKWVLGALPRNLVLRS